MLDFGLNGKSQIHEQIQGTKEKLAFSKNQELADINLQIITLQSQINELEKRREELLTNKRIITLQSRFKQKRQLPTLSLP